MAGKFALLFLFAFILVQMAYAGVHTRQRRDTPTASDAGKAIDDAVDSLKTGFDDLLKNIQSNDLFQEFSKGVQKLGDTIQEQGKDLISKIQSPSQPQN